MRIRSSWVFKLFLTVFSVLLLAGTVSLMVPSDALAAGGDITISGPGLNSDEPLTITQAQLQGNEVLSDGTTLQQQDVVYSTINTWPTKSWYRGEGVLLTDLLDAAGGIKPEATQIKFISKDGFAATFTVDELLYAPRYYFPNFMDTGLPGHLPGDPSGKVLVDTIIAHRSFSAQDYGDIEDPENFSRSDANHLLYGQRAVTQQTNARFVKYVEKIEVLTEPASKWDIPTVTPEPGVVPAGTLVEMHSPFDDEDKVHYTLDGSDPTIDSPMYNWIAARWWSSRGGPYGDLDEINHKIGPINSDTTIKAVVIGPGRSDSDIVTDEYLVPFGSASAGDFDYVAGKDKHTVAIKNDGTVWAWGDGAQGKLGNGGTETKYTPVQVSGLTDVTAVAPGYTHTLALKEDGTVWAWGDNLYGQLGNGESGFSGTRTVPEQVYGLTGVQAIDAGNSFSIALNEDGTVWSWGNNSRGQLGIGTNDKKTVAQQVYGLTDVQDIAAGKEFALALKKDGTIWGWGRNSEGELGDNSQTIRNAPVQATGLAGPAKAIAAGEAFTIAILEDDTVWGWGFNSSSQLGDGNPSNAMRTLVPVQTVDLTDVKSIAAGGNHTMALQNDGSLWIWGNNSEGQLGNGKMGYGENASKVPVKLYGPEAGIAQIYAGSNYSMAVKTDGTAWAWGAASWKSDGKLGDGTNDGRLYPTQVKRAPVTLTPSAGVIEPGEALDLTFADDAGWRESITSLIVGSKILTEFDYTVSEGTIIIKAGVLTEAGEFDITVKVAGYADSVATIEVQAQPEEPPVLAADTIDNKAGNSVDLTFTDDAAWRAAITGITVKGSVLTSDQYEVTEGNINIIADVFTAAGDYEIVVSATGYNDAAVTQPMVAVTKTWYVDDSGEADFTSIQAAVTAASAGDTIIVKDGTYNENVTVDKSLVIQSENGAAQTIVQAAVTGADVFRVTAANVTIEGFTASGATTMGKSGIAIFGASSGSCTIINNQCSGNSQGIAIEATANDNTVSNNTCTLTGRYGIYLTNTTGNSITGNTCSNNTVSSGFALYLADNADNNTVSGNTSDSNIIGIRIKAADSNLIFNNTFSNNNYGLEIATGSIGNVIYQNNFTGNTSGQLSAGYGAVAGNSWNSQTDQTYTFKGTQYSGPVGNYWSSYTGADADGNGIGDTPYQTIKTDNDNYPLMGQWQDGVIIAPVVVPVAPPVLSADTEDNKVGQSLDITFTDDADWRAAITEITVDGAALADGKYTVSAGMITIAADVFTEANDYTVVVKAAGYEDAAVVQTIETASAPHPVYAVIPEADDAYTAGTTPEGICTMTVNDSVTGFKYFTVNIAPVTAHNGNETVVFAHFRNGSQLGLNATRADFDQVEIAQAGFNIQAGDVIKAYIVDNLTNAIDFNPIILH